MMDFRLHPSPPALAPTPGHILSRPGLGQLPLDLLVHCLLQDGDLDATLAAAPPLRQAFDARLGACLERGFVQLEAATLGEIHRALFLLYGQAFDVPHASAGRQQFHPVLMQARRALEAAWEAALESAVVEEVDRSLAADSDFAQILIGYCSRHRLSSHPFFDFVEHEASREDLITFFLSDSAVVLRFFDLLVLALVGADDEIRGELVDNLWDEMGQRDPQARHHKLFLRLLNYVGIDSARIQTSLRDFHRHASWPCLAGHNLYLLLGSQRRHYFRSLGCLGSAELMDAAQYAKVVRGCQRLGWNDREGLAYYTSHAEVDAAHGLGWLERVSLPLVGKYPHAARELLLGTAFRLETAAVYYDSLLAAMRTRPSARDLAGRQLELVADGFGGEGFGDEGADVQAAGLEHAFRRRVTGDHQEL